MMETMIRAEEETIRQHYKMSMRSIGKKLLGLQRYYR